MRILYAYPQWHKVSFSLIAKKHVEYLKRLGRVEVYELDELMVPTYVPSSRYTLILHPGFYIMHRVLESRRDIYGRFREDYYQWWRGNYDQLIGIDVCDSDQYTALAVALANRFDKFIVPSKFCTDVAKLSGIKAKIYRLPHGVDPEWYTVPNVWEIAPVKSINPSLLQLYLYKIRKGKKLIAFWLWHSAGRKGWDEVYQVYTRLAKERNDVTLVLKTMTPGTKEFQMIMQYGAIEVYGWLSDYEKMALYDLVDVTLNFSRGGGFELNCLESLARGTPCIASDYGSWVDYVPEFLQVKRGAKVQPLPGNALHGGYGYAVDVEDALNKLHQILDNLEEYKAKTQQWRHEVLMKLYRWDVIAHILTRIVED
mgnify:CR=1 FL=1